MRLISPYIPIYVIFITYAGIQFTINGSIYVSGAGFTAQIKAMNPQEASYDGIRNVTFVVYGHFIMLNWILHCAALFFKL